MYGFISGYLHLFDLSREKYKHVIWRWKKWEFPMHPWKMGFSWKSYQLEENANEMVKVIWRVLWQSSLI